MKRREKRSTRLLLEELEPRILHSADLAVLVSPAALVQVAEIRLVDSSPGVMEGAAAAEAATAAPRALAIVDSAVADYRQLVADLEANSNGTLEVFVLDPLIDGVEQISKILATQHDIQTIHIVSHGSAGALQLGAGVLASDTLSQSAASLAGWAHALTPDADILIYGCDVAAGAEGRAFVDALSRLTGADVAASDDLTGNAARGGDWTLEYAAGRIEAAAPFSAAFEQSWQGTLAHVDASVTFAPSVAGTWETHDLSGGAFNVPANAVIEIAISNSDTTAAQTGGVRANGSALERSFALNRPLTGTTSVEMLVQADANGRIETFASSTTNITYTMLGYWTNGTYVETAGSFSAATDATWESHSLSAYGVTAGAVAEIVITNDSPNSPQVGVRAEGSLLDRYTDIRNRGTGTGRESMTMLVKTGATAAASIEAYAQSDRPNVTFNVVGYWSTAPGTYTEAFTNLGQPGASGAWESKSLAAYGVPAGVVADVLFLNLEPGVSNSAGVREVGGTGARVLALNSYGTTATAGPDNGRMLAKTSSDAASKVEWFDTDAAASAFYLMGYFQNNAPTLGSAADLTAIAEDPASNPGNLVSSLFAATDADGDPRGIAVTAADDTHGAWQYSTDGGTAWTAFGTPAAASARLLAPSALVRFVPAPNWNGAAGLTFRAWDQTSGTAGGTADTTANGGASAFSSTTATSGITVTAVNDAPTVTDRALVFDGTDVVTVAAQPNLVATSTLTVEARVQRTGPLGIERQIILNKEGEYEISISTTGTLQWAFADTTPGWTWTDTGITVAADTWVDVAVTFNSGVVNAYIDGSLAYTYAGTGNIGDAHPTMNDLTIGGRQNSTGERFIGLIDDVRVWNVERSGAQIQAAHATAPAGNEAGLVGYWRFDESSGTTATDSSTQRYDGVLGNGVAANAPARTTNLDYTTAEDTALAVNAQGVLTRATDPDGTALTATLVTGPAHAAAFTLNPDGSFSYTPTANYNGADSFVFTASDGSLSSQAATVRLTVTAVNDAPTLSAGTLAAIDEDTSAPSGAAISAIFSGQFSDVDAGSSFSGIAVVGNSASAVTQGVWQYSSNGGTNWFAIGSVADGASARALSASTLLRFVPVAGYNGTPAALTVRGLDDTYAGAFSATAATETPVDVDTTSRGGSTAIASATATVSTSVTSVNDAPAGTATTLTTLEDTAHIFTAADFGFTDLSDSPANALLSVRIATVPGAGTLALSGLAVSAGQSIAVADIDAGNLRFTPAANANGAAYASFTFQVRDDGGIANGGVDLDPVARTLTLDVTAVNDAPVVAGTNDMAGINRNPVSNPGTLVADLVSGHVSDSDAASLSGIAVTGVDNTNGAWQYSTDGGSTWSAFGAAGAATARLLAADVATFVRFVPNANFSGTVANGLTYKAWDETVGVVGGTADTTTSGGATAFSAATVSASITVTASNTAPSLTGSNNLAPVNEDAAANGGTLVSALIAGFASDADPGALTGIAVTAIDNTNGAWQYSLDSGGSWSAFGTPAASSARLLAADASTYVRFVPNADWNGTVNGGITFRAWDRSTGVAGSTADTSGVAGTFRDNFQTASYANNDGTLAWTGSWVETDSQGGGAASGRFEIMSGVLVIQAANVGDNIYREANLSGATGATLSFAYGSNLKGNASLQVQVSSDGGASYTTLAGGVFNASTNTFAGSRSFDITSSIASNTRVRWVVVGSESASDSNLVYVDNIQITASARNGGGTAFSTATAASAITVDPVNDAPVRTAGSVANLTVLEDAAATSLALSALAYAPGGGADEAAQTLTYTVTALPAAALGTITLNDGTTAVTASTSYTLGQLQGMKFKAAANAAGGPSTFSWTVADSGGTANGGVDTLTQSLTVTVTAVNDAPAGADRTITTAEDTAYTFTAADFGFTDSFDSPAHALSNVRLSSVPGAGTLALSGVAVGAGQFVSVAAINAGNLKFTPAPNANGAAYASFTFQVQDDGGVANGGVDTDPTPRTMTFDVTAVNDAPAGTNKTVTTLEDTAYTFGAADFGFSDSADAAPNALLSVRIATVPAAGSLTLSGVAVASGQFVSAASIDAGDLKFIPAANANGAGYASFTFQVRDDGGVANGGADTDATARTMTVNVTSVNDAPAGASRTVTTLEDAAYIFGAADFGFADSSDAAPNTLLNVKIATLPGAGQLTLGGAAVSAGQFVSAASIAAGDLSFMPAANANGAAYASFTFQVQDDGGVANGGIDMDATARTMTVAVTSVNDAPAGADRTVATLEDTRYTFTAADFGFTDPTDANALLAVRIASLPAAGGLTLGGVAVTSGQLVSAASIAAGDLQFVPAANASGAAYASFTFQVRDDGGTGNGGVDLDPTPKTITIDVTAVNDAPVASNRSVTMLEDGAYTFRAADFGFADPADAAGAGANALSGARISTLPLAGTLACDFVPVSAGQLVSLADLNAGKLIFIPAANANGANYASFTFQVKDDGGVANGGADLDAIARTMSVNVTAVNDAPAGADNTVATREDVPYTFSAADFGYTDAQDSNALLNVKVASLPAAGTLTLAGVAVTSGQSVAAAALAAGDFKFTPAQDRSGAAYASFTFQVQDDGGVANGGADTDATARTLTVNVTSINDAPAGTSNTVATLEDTAYVFRTADFGFSDTADSNALLNVKIGALPGAGSLTLDGVAVASGQSVSAAEIAAGALRFDPAADANGAGYASFTFQVQDDGGTANGGIDLAQSASTMTITVTPVNDAPAGTDASVATLEDTAYTFSAADFGFSDRDGNALLAVKIVALPAAGNLTLGVVAVSAGQVVSASSLAAGDLKFSPAANASGAAYASFTFQVQDDGGTANAGADSDPVARLMLVNVTSVNDAPAGIDATVSTREDIPYTLSAADFGFTDAADPAPNALLAVKVGAMSGGGTFTLAGTPVAVGQLIPAARIGAGELQFTPERSGTGAGYATITFQVRDDGGTANGGIDTGAPRTLTVDVIRTRFPVDAGLPVFVAEPAAPQQPSPAAATEETTESATDTRARTTLAKIAASLSEALAQTRIVAGNDVDAQVSELAPAPQREADAAVLRSPTSSLSARADGNRPVLAAPDLTFEAKPEAARLVLVPTVGGGARAAAAAAAAESSTDTDAKEQAHAVLTLENGVRASAIIVSAGLVSWTLQGAGLIASLLTSAPAWRHLDPLPVLAPEEEKPDWGENDGDAQREEAAADSLWRVT